LITWLTEEKDGNGKGWREKEKGKKVQGKLFVESVWTPPPTGGEKVVRKGSGLGRGGVR